MIVPLFVLLGGALWEHELALERLDGALAANNRAALDRYVPVFERSAARADFVRDVLTFSRTAPAQARLRNLFYEIGLRSNLLNPDEVRKRLQDCRAIAEEPYPASSHELLVSLTETLAELNRTLTTRDSLHSALTALTARKKRLVEQHRLVADDMSEFFSLPSKYALGKDDVLHAYRLGILQDLPALQNIPDGIADLVALREALREANGKVVLDSDNPAREFSLQLSRMRGTSTPIVTEYRQAEEDEVQKTEAAGAIGHKALALAEKVRRQIRATLPSAMRLQLD